MPDIIEPSLTFGFEAEWGHNIDPLLRALCDDGYLPDPTLHRYHCDCDYCDIDSENLLRAQADSTCAGELISIPFRVDQDNMWQYLLDQIEQHAVEFDVEPGVDAGFHVHVSNTQSTYHAAYHNDGTATYDPTYQKFLALSLVMPLFSDIATGRHATRSDMNTPFNRFVANAWTSATGQRYSWPSTPLGFRSNISLQRETICTAFRIAFDSDRHADVSFNTRYQTTEYRLWRSSRSSWRMRMYILASALFNSPQFHQAILTADLDWDSPTTDLTLAVIDLIDGSGQPLAMKLARDLVTQHEYIHHYLRTHELPHAYAV